MTEISDRWSAPGGRRTLATGALAIGVVAAEVGAALLAVVAPVMGLAAAVVVVAVAAVAIAPRHVLSVAFIATFLPFRVGLADVDLSVTDAYTVVAVAAAIPYVAWGNRALRTILAGLLGYLAVLSVVVLASPSEHAILEWAHRGVLFGGAILIGHAVVRSGQLRVALRLFVAASAVVGVVAVGQALANDLAPAYPFDLQKNHAGMLLAACFMVLLATPELPALPRWATRAAMVASAIGLLATQARGAALALVAVVFVRFLMGAVRSQGGRRTSPLAALGLVVLAVGIVAFSAQTLVERDLGEDRRPFGAVETRLDAYDYAFDVWQEAPILGGGLRYWTDPDRPGAPAPHNLLVGELGEAGIVGLAAFVGLLAVVTTVLVRERTRLAELGLLEFCLHLLRSLADIYWVAGPLTLTGLFVGVGISDGATDRARPTPGYRSPSPGPPSSARGVSS